MSIDFGNRSEEVKQAIFNRRASGYRIGKDEDGFKIGLVVEGGGMRGTISSSNIDALHQLGFGNCFDAIYGTSAGAINGAYFISGDINIGASIYYESIANKQFINLLRWPNVMSMDYLYNNWIIKGKPFDRKKVLTSPIMLYISVTNVETGGGKFFTNEINDERLLISCLRASTSTPLFSSNKEFIQGATYNDGMIYASIPYKKAIEDKCTHILCILTREYGYRKTNNNLLKMFERIMLKNYSQAYRQAYNSRIDDYNNTLDRIYSTDTVPTLAITPEKKEHVVNNGESNSLKLTIAAKLALLRVAAVLGENPNKLRLYIEKKQNKTILV